MPPVCVRFCSRNSTFDPPYVQRAAKYPAGDFRYAGRARSQTIWPFSASMLLTMNQMGSVSRCMQEDISRIFTLDATDYFESESNRLRFDHVVLCR
jgi:hypothetical protein